MIFLVYVFFYYSRFDVIVYEISLTSNIVFSLKNYIGCRKCVKKKRYFIKKRSKGVKKRSDISLI